VRYPGVGLKELLSCPVKTQFICFDFISLFALKLVFIQPSEVMAEKFDVFVGNLTFNTTEEQLREKFSFVGL
jgi:hypothetical protein